jgi:hypothetical protein
VLLDGALAFIEPSDGGPKGGSVRANFSRGADVLEHGPEGLVVHLLHPDVVELKQIDPVGLQPLERLVDGLADESGGKILGNLALALALAGEMVEVVADLGGDHDLIAPGLEGLGDQPLASPVAVGVGGVKEGDSQVERFLHEGDGLFVGVIAPPAGAEGPEAESDLGNAYVRLGKISVFHGALVLLCLAGRKFAMDSGRLQQEIDRLFAEMVELQERKVLEIARAIEPRLTRDDLWNAFNHPKLDSDPYFQYEDGHLAGLMAARIAVIAALRDREPDRPGSPNPAASPEKSQ